MHYSFTLLSRNPKEVVEFWIKALGLHSKDESMTNDGDYSYVDLYHRNQKIITIVKSETDTKGLEVSIEVFSIEKEFAKLSKRGLDCKWFPQKKDLFTVEDPQGNCLNVYQNSMLNNSRER